MKSKKDSLFVFLCCLVYFTSYLTRINFAAVLVEIISELEISKEIGSFAVTGAFVTYGAGQLVSGVLGDKISPYALIGCGLAGSGAINIAVSVLPDIVSITVLWCFNGFFQALFWPPLVRLMADRLDARSYARSCVLVSGASSVATIVVYLLSPLLIVVSGWRTVFAVCGAAALAVLAVWVPFSRSGAPVGPRADDSFGEEKVRFSSLASSGIFAVMGAIVLQGILRDGITTWMPAYIKDIFNFGSASSILSAVVLPVFSIISVAAASVLQDKIKNELLSSFILFGTGFVCSVLLFVSFNGSFVISVLLMALVTGCMHGTNLMLISRIPVHFRRLGKVSSVSGMLNACTYVGSALSAYGFAFFSEKFGWGFVISLWAAVCALGALLSAITVKRWRRFTDGLDEKKRTNG